MAVVPSSFLWLLARGLDLSDPDAVPAETVERIKHDVFKHRLVVFKGLGKLSAEAQLKVRWPVDYSTVYPVPRLLRVVRDRGLAMLLPPLEPLCLHCYCL